MAVLSWVMMGLAIWHFTIWLPDRVIGGIVGAFLIAGIGAAIGGLIINGFVVPHQRDLDLTIALEGIPGTIIALAAGFGIGTLRGETD